MSDDTKLGAAVLAEARDQFAKLKAQAEGAMAQVDDSQFFHVPGEDANAIAHVVKHIAGNARSRWTDFLTSDGEKPDRHRDTEFELAEETAATRAALMAAWAEGWRLLDAALAPLQPGDLLRTVMIRGEPHSVLKAIDRQLTHYGAHVGQIVLLARLARGHKWESLSIPRGRSAEFNAKMSDPGVRKPS